MKKTHLFDSIAGLFAVATFVILDFTMCTGKKEEGAQGPQFHINGHIEGAEGNTLYLEAMQVNGLVAIDSVRLGSDGAFSFAYSDTASCPEFYRLRINEQIINLSIDSTETVGVEAKWPNMAFNYQVTGSGNCDTIRILSYKLAELERNFNEILSNGNYKPEEQNERLQQLLKTYKDSVKIQYIQNNYDRAFSYYAIMQMLGSYYVFNTESDASDVQWLNAIANAWSERYPGCERTKMLCGLAIRGRKNTRPVELKIDNEKVKETGIIDMGFPDITGKERRLSQLKGQVVLLDFTAYSPKESKERIIYMRELYEKYHSRGLEIYQVSLDNEEHYWKTVCRSLPWICVYNAEGVYNDMITLYQVQQINTYFLIDRDNNLVNRSENIPDLEKAIEELL